MWHQWVSDITLFSKHQSVAKVLSDYIIPEERKKEKTTKFSSVTFTSERGFANYFSGLWQIVSFPKSHQSDGRGEQSGNHLYEWNEIWPIFNSKILFHFLDNVPQIRTI